MLVTEHEKIHCWQDTSLLNLKVIAEYYVFVQTNIAAILLLLQLLWLHTKMNEK
jgi:hypothetical protein